MTTIKALVNQHFGEQSPECYDTIVSNAIGYLFRVRSANDLTAAIREGIPGARVIDFRKDLQKGYYLRNVKLWLWRIIDRDYNARVAWKMMTMYEISPEDKEIARIVMRDKVLLADIQELKLKFKSHHLSKYDAILDEILTDLNAYVARFAYRKLRFITMGGFMSLEDIVSELQANGLYAMRLQYPKVQTRLHLTNVCKNAIRNFGFNMIAQYTTKGRQHLQRQDDGTFQAIKISIDAANREGLSYGGDNFLGLLGQSSDIYGDDNTENRTNIVDIMSVREWRANLSGRQKRFAELLCGEFDQPFSDWLAAADYAPNDELCDTLLANDNVNEYVSLVTEYLGLTDNKAITLMNAMRASL